MQFALTVSISFFRLERMFDKSGILSLLHEKSLRDLIRVQKQSFLLIAIQSS